MTGWLIGLILLQAGLSKTGLFQMDCLIQKLNFIH